MLDVAGVTSEELEILRASVAWPAQVAAVHTVPRELRAINDYAADVDRISSAIDVPVLLVVGKQTDPYRRSLFERSVSPLKHVHVCVLPGQRHAAHQTAPGLLANAVRDFFLGD